MTNPIPVIFILVLSGSPMTQIENSPNILIEHYPNGKIHTRIEIDEHREPHGWSREYSKKGFLKAERQYVHGIRDGISRLYYSTGELMTEWKYNNGKRHGTSTGYFKNGLIKDRGTYENDLLEGTVFKYYPSGAVKARMNFKHDRLEGESTIYYENGQIQHVYRYFEGRIWTRTDYDQYGKLIRKQEFPQPPLQP